MPGKNLYLGLDPGQSGGIGIVGGVGQAYKWPETEHETARLVESIVDGCHTAAAVIEAVHSMPKQGVASSFKFGQHYGFLRGLLVALKIPFIDVSPQRWQKAIGCLTHGDKNVSKAMAQQLFPNQKFTHATADAMLLALYCSRLSWAREE